MSILFYSSVAIPIIESARKYNCRIMLVKDGGVYLMVNTHNKMSIGYAKNCNPDIDPDYFDYSSRHLGGNDFFESFDPHDKIFDWVINYQLNLQISRKGKKILLSAVRGESYELSESA